MDRLTRGRALDEVHNRWVDVHHTLDRVDGATALHGDDRRTNLADDRTGNHGTSEDSASENIGLLVSVEVVLDLAHRIPLSREKYRRRVKGAYIEVRQYRGCQSCSS